MKKVFSLFATLALLLFSCQQEPMIEDDGRIVLSIQKEGKKVETSSIDFIGEGGTIEVGLTCKGDWTVNAAPSSWLSVSPTSGTDDATLSVKALVNTDRDSRLGAVIVTCGDENTTLTVTQSGTWLELSTDSLLFASAGGADTLKLSSNVVWKVITEESWLKVSTASGKGDATLVVTAADNASPSSRKGNITISSDGYNLPITIIQDARYLIIETETIHFANEGGRYEVSVDDDGTFDVTSDVEWLAFEKQENGFTVVAAENATPDTRNATITVFLSDLTEGTMERTISASQDSRYLNVGTSYTHFDNAGGRSEAIAVDCNGTFDVRSDVDWLTFEKHEDYFIATATDNATPYTRNATITVYLSDLAEGTLERTISVSQDARYLNVGTTSIRFVSTGGSESILVECNGVFDVKSDAEWLEYERQEGSFIVIATDNATLNLRNTTITVFLSDLLEGTLELTICVSQDARYLNVGTTSIRFANAKGKSEVISVDCNGIFEVKSDADWLTFEKQENSFFAIVAENTTPYSRDATITVSLSDLTEGILEQKIVVVQDGAPLGEENGHEWVNLGLPSGLLWAVCNVGANTSEDYGFYFAWGEITTRGAYGSAEEYKWCELFSENLTERLTKYNTIGSYGIVDNKTVLDLSDDAAHTNWGGSWRMPSPEEWNELQNNRTWTFTRQNDVTGYKVTSIKNGNSIFLPAAGYKNNNSIFQDKRRGLYWSSSICESDPRNAWFLFFDASTIGCYGKFERWSGITVRPVCRP